MKTRHVALVALIGLVAITSTGCATLMSGTDQMVTIYSYPPGAQVRIGHQSGITPATFRIPKGEDYPIEISQGPDHRVIPLERTVDRMTWLNAIPPLWPGFLIDHRSGATYKYAPDVITVDFRMAPSDGTAYLARYRH